MKISIEKRRTWIPDFKENTMLPEEERVVFIYDKPLAGKRDAWQKVVASRDSKGQLSTYVERNTAQIIRDSNVEIRNLFVIEEGEEREIRKGEDLLSVRSDICSAFVALLVNEILKEDYKAELPS